MRAARLSLLAVLLLLVTMLASAQAGPPPGPKSLKGFLLRPNEPVTHTFSRTPAFSWQPVRGAACYEFQLATSRTFDGSSVIWSNVPDNAGSGRSCRSVKLMTVTTAPETSGDVTSTTTANGSIAPIRVPALALGLTLPWFTGNPYALYARVRGVSSRGPTRWSAPFGFNMRWEDTPVPMVARPGLVRWKPVEGATSYQVWYTDVGASFSTHTNVADQRELYTFHSNPAWWQTVRWRVRAVRQVLGSIPNGLPAVSYGPWSPEYATTNADVASGPLQTKVSVSDVVSSSWTGAAHSLMPALTFSGAWSSDTPYGIFRVYAATDRDCVNIVYRGSVTGAPAYAPRTSGPLKLPTSLDDIDTLDFDVLPSGKSEDAKTYMADGTPVVTNETLTEDGFAPKVDLPDVDAKTTRYFWTVVRVGIRVTPEGTVEYYDMELPQDVCENGRVATFAKVSRPAVTAAGAPYVAGLSPTGRMLSSVGQSPLVYSTPLIAWRPVMGASAYRVEWSRTKYPWRGTGRLATRSTSAVLRLKPGRWYYRVRGLNPVQVGTAAMTWSHPVAIRVARPTFRITGG
jgi:hypothetical protein